MILTIFCIVFLMAVALWFIADNCAAHYALEFWKEIADYRKDELQKYRRPRDSKGRFTK